MLNAQLLADTWEQSFLGRRPYDVLTLVGYEFPSIEELDGGTPILDELAILTDALAHFVYDKTEGHPLSIFTTGIALGYLAANREALEGMSP
jgi:hypothetical protein